MNPKFTNSCCIPNAFKNSDLTKANPFDPRPIKNQPNNWCSNELILRDASLRCQARIQPLDVELNRAMGLSRK